MTLTLTHKGWSLVLRPDLGGSVASLRLDGVDVLRATPADAADPLDTACFPLVPYANRIGDGRFAFAGIDHALPLNADGQAHPLHGVGWKHSWDVAESDARAATLVHTHPGDAHWPWIYGAEQRFELGGAGLRVTLSVANRDTAAMPVGLGFHPYFPATPETRLRFTADAVWLTDAGLLPVERVPAGQLADWAAGDAVCRAALIDNAYEGWSGSATIETPGRTVRLGGEGTPYLHVFTPPGADFFCAEPVGTMPDAVNRAPLVQALEPGRTHRIAMTLALA